MCDFKSDKFYRFIFGVKEMNESSKIFISQYTSKGVILLEKFKNDSIVSEVFVDFKDTAIKRIHNRFFKDYSYKLSQKEAVINDTLYVYNFTRNTYSINKSHATFIPLSQVFISKKYGICKVVLEDKCFQVVYE
jgi:hypothetical protein